MTAGPFPSVGSATCLDVYPSTIREHTVTLSRPFFKWAGGKRRIASAIVDLFPPSFDDYVEPFLGGGAVFLEAARRRPSAYFSLSDKSVDVIAAWKAVAAHVDDLVDVLKHLARDTTSAGYLRERGAHPQTVVDRAARFLYLNRLGFNGLWRENAKGEMNVPYGGDPSRDVVREEVLRDMSRLLRSLSVNFFCQDFESRFPGVVLREDFVQVFYFDPPFVPHVPETKSRTPSFTGYVGGFKKEDQARLADWARCLQSAGAHVFVSQSDTEESRRLFEGFRVVEIETRRSVGASASTRKKIKELVFVSSPERGTGGPSPSQGR